MKMLRKICFERKNSVEPSRKKKDSGCKTLVYVCVLLIQRTDVPRGKLSVNGTAFPLLKRCNWVWQLSPNGLIKGEKVVFLSGKGGR